MKPHPTLDLLARYKAIFIMAWRHRAELAGPQRLADEAAFLPAALSLAETPVHPAPRRFAYAIMLLFGIALLWNPAAVVAIYSALGGLVALAHWLYPNVRSHSASKTKGMTVNIRSTYGHAEAANEVGELLKAA